MEKDFLLLNHEYRKQVIDQINSDENKIRKNESKRKYEIYRDRMEPFIVDILNKQYSKETVKRMRTVTSINLCKAVVNEQAAIYNVAPQRELKNASDSDQERIEKIYDKIKADSTLKKANRFFKLEDQCALYVMPKNGYFKARVLLPHDYDVIENPSSPEEALGYVLSVYDTEELFQKIDGNTDGHNSYALDGRAFREGINQKIADQDDYKSKKGVYLWWSKSFNFFTDGAGNVLNDEMKPYDSVQFEDIANPIGMLPFVDIAYDKDGTFFVRNGSGPAQAAIDFALLISDISEINRLQGYSQPVLSSVEKPQSLYIGPNVALWLKKDRNAPAEAQPEFTFATPSPDLAASLTFLDKFSSLFLTSNKISAKTVTSDGAGEKFTSGLDRMLAMIEKFSASSEDFSLFEDVETEMFEIIKAWLRVYEGVSFENGGLHPSISGALPEDSYLDIKFYEPELMETKQELETSVLARYNAGLLSKAEAVAELRGIEIEEAEKLVAERLQGATIETGQDGQENQNTIGQ